MNCKTSSDHALSSVDNISNLERVCNVESRLRLKRINTESTNVELIESERASKLNAECMDEDKHDEQFEKDENEPELSVPNENDSISDFKSPDTNKFKQTKIGKPARPIAKRKKTAKSNLNIHLGNRKQVKSKENKRSKKNDQTSQPPIESSFFKVKDTVDDKDASSNVKAAFLCPLCFKICKDADIQAVHMKNCANKNKISTKTLLTAIELQERQASERKSMGLLAAPIVQERKKVVAHKTNIKDESDFELALALSKSLQESEELNEITDAHTIFNARNPRIVETTETTSKGLLERFGFANTKPVKDVKSKRRGPSYLTTLQTRSEEERNRILTEKIGEILMGNEAITQKSKVECNEIITRETVLRSDFLQQHHWTENRLWDKARLTPSRKRFFAAGLSAHIMPHEELHTDEKKDEHTGESIDYTIDLEPYRHQAQMYYDNNFAEVSDTICVNSIEENNEDLGNDQYSSTLVRDWGNALNDSAASDLIIFVNDSKHIWVHKLVLYVRCSDILLDILPNDNSNFSTVKEKICWIDLSYNVALAFLEFIYCGSITKYVNILEDDNALSSLRNMARRYKVRILFSYLRTHKTSLKNVHDKLSIAKPATPETLKTVPSVTNSEISIIFTKTVSDDAKEDSNLTERGNSIETETQESVADITSFPQKELEIISPQIDNRQISPITNDTNAKNMEEVNCTIRSQEDNEDDVDTTRLGSMSPDMFDDNIINSDDEHSVDADMHYKHNTQNRKMETILAGNLKIAKSPDSERNIFVNKQTFDETTETLAANKTKSPINDLLVRSPCTPQSSKSTQERMLLSCSIPRQKSNLTLFIEKVQRANARQDFESDSELDTMLEVSVKLNRNPFNINQNNDSDTYCEPHKISDNQTKLEKKTSGLDVLDYKTTGFQSNHSLEENVIQNENSISTFVTSQSIADLMQEDESGTRYSSDSFEEDININNSKQIVQEAGSTPMEENDSKIECGLTLDCEINEDEMSMYSKYKKAHQNNSIAKYRVPFNHVLNTSVKDSEANNRKSEAESDEDKLAGRKRRATSEDIIILSDIEIDSLDLADISSTKKCRKSSENYEQFCNASEASLFRGEYSFQQSIIHNNADAEINANDGTNKKTSQRIDDTNNKFTDDEKLLKETRNGDSSAQVEINKSRFLESPVLVHSSSEFNDEFIDDLEIQEMNKTQKDCDMKHVEFDTDFILEKDIFLSNVCLDDKVENNISSLVNGQLSNLRRHNSTNDIKLNTIDLNKHKNNECNKVIGSVKETLNGMKSSVRSFRRKSVSEGNLILSNKHTKNVISEPEIADNLCKCGKKSAFKRSLRPRVVQDNITSPPNYECMKTEELQKELSKYGLKLQKRSRAVKLLTYIYNELHPVISHTREKKKTKFKDVNNEYQEPPAKRLNQDTMNFGTQNYDDYELLPVSQDSDVRQSPVNVIAEEMQFDEPEPITLSNSISTIKEAFLRLIKSDKTLYNKVLTYEPLCIESLHARIKASGFKCKMNTLMDFLDEQCITFYVEDSHSKNRTRKVQNSS